MSIESTVTIGNQTWMRRNLDISQFRNGDIIPQAKSDEEWDLAGLNSEPAWCYYNNNPNIGRDYGKLYNWYAINDPRGLAPQGWHIPTDMEWYYLAKYVGTIINGSPFSLSGVGYHLESRTGWKDGHGGKDDFSFRGLPGGVRFFWGKFSDLRWKGWYWTSSQLRNSENGMARILDYELNSAGVPKNTGLSVRCLRD